MGLENTPVLAEQAMVVPIRTETSLEKKRRPRRTPEEIHAFDSSIEPLLSEGLLLKKQIAYKLGVPTYFVCDASKRLEEQFKMEGKLKKISKLIKNKDIKTKSSLDNNKKNLKFYVKLATLFNNNNITEDRIATILGLTSDYLNDEIRRLKDSGVIKDSRRPRTSQEEYKFFDKRVKLFVLAGLTTAEMAAEFNTTETRINQAIRGLIYRGELPKGTKPFRKTDKHKIINEVSRISESKKGNEKIGIGDICVGDYYKKGRIVKTHSCK